MISPTHRKPRKGKGFSLEELKAIGLTFEKARKMRLPIDKRRKSKHEENVKILMEFLEKVQEKAK